MKPERGLTFPRADLHLDPLTADDLRDLDFVAGYADLIGFSFVQSADDITRLQDELAGVAPIGGASASSPRSRRRRR